MNAVFELLVKTIEPKVTVALEKAPVKNTFPVASAQTEAA